MFATVCSVVITLLGAACIFLLPVAQYPEITPPKVTVSANYVGANAEVVESTVTNILERELNEIEGVRYITSTISNNGICLGGRALRLYCKKKTVIRR